MKKYAIQAFLVIIIDEGEKGKSQVRHKSRRVRDNGKVKHGVSNISEVEW